MKEVGRRIFNLRNELQLSREELAERTNLAPITIWRYETSDNDNITLKNLQAIAKALGVSASSLISQGIEGCSNAGDFSFVPVVRFSADSFTGETREEILGGYPVNIKELNISSDIALKLYVIEGGAMAPKYRQGDLVLCSLTGETGLADGDIAAVLYDKKFYVRGYFKNSDGSIDLRPVAADCLTIHAAPGDNRLKLTGKVLCAYRTIRDNNFYG